MANETEGESGAIDAEASVLLENGEPVAAIVSLPEGDEETGGDDSGDTSEAVALATIEADTAVTVAAINAEVETARIAAEAERVITWEGQSEEIASLQASMREQAQTIASLTELVASLSQSIPILQPEPAPSPEQVSETAAEPNSIPGSIVETETQTEHGQSVEEESGAAEVVLAIPARKRRRLI